MMQSLSLYSLIILIFFILVNIGILSCSEVALVTYKRLHAFSPHHSINKLLKKLDQFIMLMQLLKYLLLVLALIVLISSAYWPIDYLRQAVLLGGFTLILLTFGELIPRQLGRLYPEQILVSFKSLHASLMFLGTPIILVIHSFISLVLFLLRPKQPTHKKLKLSGTALKHLVALEEIDIPPTHLEMLISIADLECQHVEDIMIPRHQLSGIDLAGNWNEIQQQLIHSLFTRILIYEDSVDNILGFVHLRRLLPLLAENKLDKSSLRNSIRPAYFIPKGTSLIQQLINFREQARRSAIVVDEYGGILGMLALEDILEEIVGEFSTTPIRLQHTIQLMPDGSAWLDGGTSIREINQTLQLNLPMDGPKTINGLIMDYLESIPVPGMTVLIDQHPMEIRKTRKNAIKTLIIYPAIQKTIS